MPEMRYVFVDEGLVGEGTGGRGGSAGAEGTA